MKPKLENVYKGWFSSIFGSILMVYAAYGWHEDWLSNAQAGGAAVAGFVMLFLRHRLEQVMSEGLGRIFDAVMDRLFGKGKGNPPTTIILLLILFSAASAYAQKGAVNATALRFVNVLDSTTVLPINGTIYYNQQHMPPKFRVYENGAWRDLFSSAGGAFWPLSGSATQTGTTSITTPGGQVMTFGDSEFTGGWTLNNSAASDFLSLRNTGLTVSGTDFSFTPGNGTFNFFANSSTGGNANQSVVNFNIGTGDPLSLSEGDFWYNPTADVFKGYAGASVVTFNTGAGGTTETASNGLNKVGNDIQLGGPILSNRSMTYNDPTDFSGGDVTNRVDIGNAGSFQFEAFNVSSASGGNGLVFFDNQESLLTINPNKFESSYTNNTSGAFNSFSNGVSGINSTVNDTNGNYAMIDIGTSTAPFAQVFLNDATTFSNHYAYFGLDEFEFNFQDASNNDATTMTIDETGVTIGGTVGNLKISNLISGRLPLITTGGQLTSISTLTYSGSTLQAGGMQVGNLVPGQVVYTTTNDALAGESGFEYNASTNTLEVTNIELIGGGLVQPVTNTSADITLDGTAHSIYVNASGANRTVTLNTSTPREGQTYTIVKTDATVNTVTISDPALFGGNKVISVQGKGYTVQYNGTNWYVISAF